MRRTLCVAVVFMKSELSIEEKQWLLIVKAKGSFGEVPDDVRASLAAKGLINEGGESALTALGASQADEAAAENFKLSLTPVSGT